VTERSILPVRAARRRRAWPRRAPDGHTRAATISRNWYWLGFAALVLAALRRRLAQRRLLAGPTKRIEPPPQKAVLASGSAKKEDGDANTKEDKVALWLTGGFSLVTTVLTVLGATGVGLQRLLLNHTYLALVAFLLMAVGIAAAIVAYVGHWDTKPERGILLFGSLAFGGGLILAVGLAVVSPSDQSRPAVSAQFKRDPDQGLILVVTVKGEQLPATATGFTVVDGLSIGPGKGTVERLYLSHTGPNFEGKIERALEVPIPPGKFDEVAVLFTTEKPGGRVCEPMNVREGCLRLRVPEMASRPGLTARWETPPSDPPFLSVTTRALGLAESQSVHVRVFGIGGKGRTLLSAVLSPNSLGTVDSGEIRVPISASQRAVCVMALVTEEGTGPPSRPRQRACGEPPSPDASSIRLPVPSRVET
jgi:hypothetical protein